MENVKVEYYKVYSRKHHECDVGDTEVLRIYYNRQYFYLKVGEGSEQ